MAATVASSNPTASSRSTIDIPATRFHHDGSYRLAAEQRDLTAEELVGELAQ
jgi:hypothetical protein